MKCGFLLSILLILLIWIAGCAPDVTRQETSNSYVIEAALDCDAFSGEVSYPKIVDGSGAYESINSEIKEFVYSYLGNAIGTEQAEVTVDISYSITINNNDLICFLFEGTLMDKKAAHPTNVAFSVLISLVSKEIVEPLDYFKMDEAFFEEYRKQLLKNQNQNRFSDENWEQISGYLNNFSNEEVQNILLKNAPSSLALIPDGVIVLFPVPHAIGDYVALEIPCEIRYNP